MNYQPGQTMGPGLIGSMADILEYLLGNQKPRPVYPNAPGNSEVPPATGLLADIHRLGFKDVDTLLLFLRTSVKGVNDDKKFLLERLIELLSKLPANSRERKNITDSMISGLWDSLDHPPVASLGKESKYREADGSNNNLYNPKLGAANTPYARSARPQVYQSPNPPAATTLFDTLLAREPGKFREHPNKISSMLFYLATIITHDIFQTNHDDYNINCTSSYLDLAPLYGRNQDEQDMVRTHKDGLLKPDCFSSDRVLGFPPGVGVFLIMFNRFHNYVVTQLAKINEGGRFTKPTNDDSDAWNKYDNDLFQTGRLVTCGLYVNIILSDYVRTILNLNRADSDWVLDPRIRDGGSLLGESAPEATGNQVSVEFDLVYRWHGCLSQRDEKWTEYAIKGLFKQFGDGQDPATATPADVKKMFKKMKDESPADPLDRQWAGLTRNPADQTYDDDKLVEILQASIEDVAGAFGPRHVPQCMRVIELLGIEQARSWNVATLNEFRSFIGLKPHDKFEDINSDPEIAKILRQMYDSPDAVELYTGLMTEEAKPRQDPGSGLCPGFTTSRAILSDATTLVRGDRFYTVNHTPRNLTNFGYNEVKSDRTVDYGHILHKLILRAFPRHFQPDSVYAHFPFVIPGENRKILQKLGKEDKYSWEKPAGRKPLVFVRSHKAVSEVLNNQRDFKVTWGPATKALGGESAGSFALAGDAPANTASRLNVIKALHVPPTWRAEVRKFYEETTRNLLHKYGAPIAGPVKGARTFEVDVVRDVIGLAHARFTASMFSLPLKEDGKPGGYTEEELYKSLVAMFAAIFWDSDVANSPKLRQAGQAAAKKMGDLVVHHARHMQRPSHAIFATLGMIKDAVVGNGNGAETPTMKGYGDQMIQRLLSADGRSLEEAVFGTIMPVVTSATGNQTQMLAECLDYYLSDGKEHLPDMRRLAKSNTEKDDEALLKYTMEGCRIRCTAASYRDAVKDQTIVDTIPCIPDPSDPTFQRPLPNPEVAASERTVKIPRGTRVLVDMTAAAHDPAVFPEPEKVRLDRPLELYTQFGFGPHRCAGESISQIALSSILKVLLQQDGLRRAKGRRGEIWSSPAAQWPGQAGRAPQDPAWTGLRTFTTADQSAFSPLATTMKINWEQTASR